MKSLFNSALMTIFLAQSAFADSSFYLSKTSSNGFVHENWLQYESCELYADKVVKTVRFGDLEKVEERTLKMSANFNEALKARVALEPIETTENFLCDGPSTEISLNKNRATTSIYSTGGCGQEKKERKGPLSLALVSMIDEYCSKTY
ncbi:MAG: hypothetical protein KBD78_01010 [Oligoflexales bacterium]|jgi:hypothetical protein|nr:hypothetical protein [Oligoflexales bacterium]